MMNITFKGIEYNIPYDYDSWSITKAIDSTFDYGYIETTPLEVDGGGLDYSRRIPRNLDVVLTIDNKEFKFKTGETHIDKLTYADGLKYKHRINLVSRTKELTKKTLENMTVTQPKGELGTYARSNNYVEDYPYETPNPPLLDFVEIPLINLVNTNTSKIEDMTIKEVQEHNITLNYAFSNSYEVIPLNVFIQVKFNGTVIQEKTVSVPKSYVPSFFASRVDGEIVDGINFKHNPSVVGTYTVEVKLWEDYITFKRLDFAITSIEQLAQPFRTYAQVVDKMLRNTEYVLSPNSRSRLNLTAPEGKYEAYMVFDGLQKIGGEVGALVRVGDDILQRLWRVTAPTTEDIEGTQFYDFNPYDYDIGTILKIGTKYYENIEGIRMLHQIDFEFFDNPTIKDIVGERDRTEIAEFEDYVSALELNTKNIIKPIRYSPFKNGWGSLRRLDGIGQMNPDNIGYVTEDNQERITKVLVKGLASQSASHTWTVNDVTDITDRVVDKRQYDTFLSQADYSLTGKSTYMKNNTLYYVQGDNKIYGMSYFGETEGRVIGQAGVTRALYETILAQRSNDVSELVTRTGNQTEDDPKLDGDLLIQLQITYENQTESRARVYKNDQTGFETDLIKYMNESSNVNETNAIGDYAQLLVNRLGGTKIIVNGIVGSLEDLADIGDMNSLGQVYTVITIKPSGEFYEYDITLVNDFNIISSYIGVNSRHTVEEIPSDSTTRRTLRYTSKVIFTDSLNTFTTRLVNQSDIFTHLLQSNHVGLNYGYLESNLSNGDVKKIHLSVDTDSKGTTLEVKWNMPDNYSAGLKRYSYDTGSPPVTVYMNTEVPYTDLYGKVTDILLGIYDVSLGTLDMNLYPEASSNNGDEVFTFINDVIDKDAREILSGLIEIPFLSESSKIRVYNGFAKYNALKGETNRIGTVALDYVPLVKDQKIDLSRSRDVTLTGNVDFNNLTFGFTTYVPVKGIAWYHKDTLDLVLAYVEDLAADTHLIRLPYYIEDGLSGGGVNISINIVSTYELGLSILGQATPQVLNVQTHDLSYETSHVEPQDEFSGVLTLNYELSNTINRIEKDPINVISIDMSYETAHALHDDFFDDIIMNYGVDGFRYVATGVTQTVIVTDLDYVQSQTNHNDEVVLVGNEYEVNSTITVLNNAINVILSTINYDTIVYRTDYVWALGGTTPTTNQTCSISTDVGNVRCDGVCTFVDTETYLSMTDDTTTPTCDDGVERITCVDNGISYTCTVSTGSITYENCETCQGTESEA